MIKTKHKPVMVSEVLDSLHIKSKARYIDATLGMGGHSSEIVKKGGFVLGFEYDPEMVPLAEENLIKACPIPHKSVGDCFKIYNRNFIDLIQIEQEEEIGSFDGVLFDLGISLLHYKEFGRGFSFADPNQSLDMRLNVDRQSVTAADLINNLDEKSLIKLFEPVLGYKQSFLIVRKILANRPLHTVGELVDIVPKYLPAQAGKKNPATKVFLALRIAVNSELENLKVSFLDFLNILKSGGKFLVITFHSLEEREVSELMKDWERKGLGEMARPVGPSQEEVDSNPLARSARLWIFTKK